MVTELGKFLRKIRVDKGEYLKDMSRKLGVSAAFISAVENGNKRMPQDWNQKICEVYRLDAEGKKAFFEAVALSEKSYDLHLDGLPNMNRKIGVALARKLATLTTEEKKTLQMMFDL